MVFEKVKEIVVEQLGLEGNEITEETSFDSLGVDSLDLFQIIIEIEEVFNIQIENAEEMKTVKDAVKYIESKIA